MGLLPAEIRGNASIHADDMDAIDALRQRIKDEGNKETSV